MLIIPTPGCEGCPLAQPYVGWGQAGLGFNPSFVLYFFLFYSPSPHQGAYEIERYHIGPATQG